MTNWKTVGKKLLYPPVWLNAVLTVISAASLAVVFLKGWEETAVAYVVYVLSAYTLTALTMFLIKTLPRLYRNVKDKVYSTSLGNRYMTDTEFRVKVSLYISLSVNILYSVFKLASGIYYSSFWWGAFAVYYIILSVIRFLLLRYMRRGSVDMQSEYRRYRLSAIFMVLLNLSLSGIVFQMVWQNKAFTYPEVVVIASATYTFYSVTVSVIDIIKYRKYNRPVFSASKAIRFAAALVALLNLETAMLATYGENDSFRRITVGMTGGAVCLAVLAMSVYMIIKSTRYLKENNNGK